MKKTTLLTLIYFVWGFLTINSLSAQGLPLVAESKVFIIEQLAEKYIIDHEIGIIEAEDFEIEIQYVAKQFQTAPFQALDELDFDLTTHQYYWGKLVLKNSLPDAQNYTEWVLQFSSSITEIDLYVEQADGQFEKYLSGEYRPYHLKSFKPTLDLNLFRVTLPPNQPIQLYFSAQAERVNVPPVFEVTLRHSNDFATFLQTKKNHNYFLIGFFMMMIIYSLTGAILKRDSSYAYYALYILVLATHASNSAGQTEDWFGYFLFPENPKYAYLFNSMIIIGFMGYIGFMRTFLNLRQLMPTWDKIYNFLFWMCVPTLLLHIVSAVYSNYSHGISDYVLVGYSIVFIFFTLPFTYQLFKTKDKKGYFIVAGMLFILFDLLLNVLSQLELFEYPLLSFKTGFVLEILIFCLGLAYREQENVKAKEQASFELEKNKFLQEQEQQEMGRLKKMNDLKSQLYTNITHEFRTPLTVIMGMNENIKGHEKEQTLIRRNSKNLLLLINQLLDLSKAESATLQVHKTQGDIVAFLQYLTESFYSMAADKDVKLTFYSEIPTLETKYDETKIQHIFYNLLSNAIKFTEEDGKVILHVQKATVEGQTFLKIKIQDTGIGIATNQLPHIFDRFYQVDNSNTRQGEGTGIGLALVKELLQLMDGKVEVTSKKDEGTVFTVLLPIEIAAIQTTNEFSLPKTNEIVIERATSVVNGKEEDKITQNRDLPILLIIEDNKDVAQYIQTIVEKFFTIHTAKNGQLGIDKAIEIVPDIIISDVMMPLKDGYEVCEILKKDERTDHIPIILLTAKATQADKVIGLKFGADAFLTKPFHKEELLIRLEKLTELRKALQTRYAQQSMVAIADTSAQEMTPFLNKLTTHINKQLDNPDFSVADLSKVVNMSDMQVYRKLKAMTGQTPSTFIRSIRLEKGKQLLTETKLTISEIAYAVGFSNPSYFSRTFHTAFGRSPSDFRQL